MSTTDPRSSTTTGADTTATAQTPHRLAVIVASTREGRLGDRVAGWFADLARQHPAFTVDVVDLAEANLPAVQSGAHPKSGRYSPAVAAFAERIGAADAFVLVTPEYNHGYPASLKTALDAVYAEWVAKPAGFVSYGGVSGGVRAVEQLRQVLGELHVVAIRDGVALPMAARMFDEDGELIDDGTVSTAAKLMLDRLEWWTAALRTARERTPYAA